MIFSQCILFLFRRQRDVCLLMMSYIVTEEIRLSKNNLFDVHDQLSFMIQFIIHRVNSKGIYCTIDFASQSQSVDIDFPKKSISLLPVPFAY